MRDTQLKVSVVYTLGGEEPFFRVFLNEREAEKYLKTAEPTYTHGVSHFHSVHTSEFRKRESNV